MHSVINIVKYINTVVIETRIVADRRRLSKLRRQTMILDKESCTPVITIVTDTRWIVTVERKASVEILRPKSDSL